MIRIKVKQSRSFLKEIKMEDVLPRLEGKQFQKLIKFLITNLSDYLSTLNTNRTHKININQIIDEDLYLKKAKEWWSKNLPEHFAKYDIEKRHIPEAVNWALTMFLKQQESAKGEFLIDGSFTNEIKNDMTAKYLETFYQIKDQGIQRILSKSDINQIQSPQELFDIVEAATPAYEQFKEKKLQKDAGAGMNKIFENDKWQIFIPETKAAACLLGKGTDWCTAAPGLNYYEQYHKKEDPLIVFVSKLYPEIRYQFHFGSKQLMNKKDHPIENAEKDELFLLLRQVDNSLIKHLMYEYTQRSGLVFYTSTLANDVGLYRANIPYGEERFGSLTALSPSGGMPRTIEFDDSFSFRPETTTNDPSIYEEIFVDRHSKAIFDVRAKTISTNKESYSKYFPDLNKLLSLGWTLEERPQR